MKLKSVVCTLLLSLGATETVHANEALYVAKTVYQTAIGQRKVSRIRLFVHTGSTASDCSIQVGKVDALSGWDSDYVQTVKCIYSQELDKVFINEDGVRAIGDRAVVTTTNILLSDAGIDRLVNIETDGKINKEQTSNLNGLINSFLGSITSIHSLDLSAPTVFTFSDGKSDQIKIQIEKKRDL